MIRTVLPGIYLSDLAQADVGQRLGVGVCQRRPCDRTVRPADGLRDDLLHIGVMVAGAGLMAGLEVEDAALSAVPAAAAAENLAAWDPADEHQIVRLGDLNMILGHLNQEPKQEALSGGVSWLFS